MGEQQELSNGVPVTSYDVFISHSTSDAAVARATCEALEQAGVRCWIAPRDIAPGQTWSGAIVGGIDACRVLVLVFSARANESPEVLREVELASRNRKRLLTVRIENAAPTGDISYFLSATQWLDAFPPPVHPRLADLVAATRNLLGMEVLTPPAPVVPEQEFVEVDLDDFGRSGRRRGRFLDRLFDDR
jgi:hypothetical protein